MLLGVIQTNKKVESTFTKDRTNSYFNSIEYKPTAVYYIHMEDSRHIIPNWKIRRDYACCVMARTIEEAIEKTENIALSLQGARFIKIMGVVPGKLEWVNEKEPLTQNPHINIKNPI